MEGVADQALEMLAGSRQFLDIARAIAGDNFPENAYSQVLENSRVVKAGPGTLYGISIDNTNPAAQYILFFDSRTVPADTAVPRFYIRAAGSATTTESWGPYGRRFSQGIVVCNSSTNQTKTIGAADCWFDVQYV